METKNVFGIIPASSGVFFFLWGFGLFIAAIVIVVSIQSDFQAASIAVAIIVFLGVAAVFGFFGYQATHAMFTITDRGLKIGPGLYGRLIPREKIEIAGVKVINLDIDKDYQPKWRTNGAGLPGYLAGWFRLKNKEKALLFVTDRSSVVYIPTTENYSVMLSVREADLMVEQIQDWK